MFDLAGDTPSDLLGGSSNLFRLTFRVAETIRGPKVETLELELNLAHDPDLDYFCKNKTDLLLIGGSGTEDEEAKIGYTEQRKFRGETRYSFRTLAAVPEARPEDIHTTEHQINTSLNSGRMFGLDFTLANSRDEILKRARAFAKKHSEVLKTLWIMIPHEYGIQCGYTNAYCGITLPICKETEATILGLLENPERILCDVRFDAKRDRRSYFLVQLLGGLTSFRSEKNATFVRKFAEKYESLPLHNGYSSVHDVRRAADKLLATWRL